MVVNHSVNTFVSRMRGHLETDRSVFKRAVRWEEWLAEGGKPMPKKKTPVRSPWTKDDIRQLKAYSKARTPVVEVAKAMKRTEAAVRQRAKTIEIGLGHRRGGLYL
jgi:hypothetical protein